jgi:SAM-dependent methyltransferase
MPSKVFCVLADAEREADWDERWLEEPLDASAPEAEEETPRWRAQERIVLERFGRFDALEVVEIGAGRGTNALLYAKRGARATLLDLSPVALRQARELFATHGLAATFIRSDVFEPPTELRGRFDVAMSFGLCEHFLGERREAVVAAHLELVRPGGLVMLGVPNRWSPVYRLWLKVLMARGTWPLGTEVPFSPAEIRELAQRAGGTPLRMQFGSFVASVVDHGANQLLFKLRRRPLPVPQVRLPILDRLGYELLLPVVKPE